MKYVISDIRWAIDKSDGSPYVTKNGKPYMRVRIQTEFKGESIWASGFDFDGYSRDWKIGDELDLEIIQNGEYDGKLQYDFSRSKEEEKRNTFLEFDKRTTEFELNSKIAGPEKKSPKETSSLKEQGVDVSDLPF